MIYVYIVATAFLSAYFGFEMGFMYAWDSVDTEMKNLKMRIRILESAADDELFHERQLIDVEGED